MERASRENLDGVRYRSDCGGVYRHRTLQQAVSLRIPASRSSSLRHTNYNIMGSQPQREQQIRSLKYKIASLALVTWIVLFTAAAYFLYDQNRQRINDIEKQRLHSCLVAYRLSAQIINVMAPVLAIAKGTQYNEQNDTLQRITFLSQLADPKNCYKKAAG